MGKKLFGNPYSVSGVRPATSAVSPNMYQRSFGDRPKIGYAAAGKPTVQHSGGQSGMFKTPLGKMSPEELKDFQSVLSEMEIETKREFVGDLYRGEDKQYAYEPSIFNDSTADEYKKRKQRYKYLA